ncbi:DUF1345 domain-containing protein [Sediminibacterium sp.]|uniref:DUF1345 domain-containing protein n=1 Tax=Sediminibacterium sp. TaxID=1917865 RepID=UPI0025E243C8|nr:DUF1345 domain-containing protein [Sediminibacterium sp.]
MSKKIKYKLLSWLKNLSGVTKVLLCILLTVVVYSILFFLKVDPKSRIILVWDTFCLSMILLSWILFFTTTPNELCTIVENQDDGLKIIFTIVLVAVCFSLFGTLLLLNSKGESSFNKIFHTIVSLSPVLLSWILLHTTFAIRYAHLYHDHNKLNTGSNVGGLDFPTKEEPDYLDFAYFSFVIGMTFQVSDVQVNSRVIRRFVLLHSLISFVFNTIIVALTINTIAGLKQ